MAFSESEISAVNLTMAVAGCLSVAGGLFVTLSWYLLPKENSGFAKKLIAWISTADILSGAAFAYTGLAGTSEAEYMNNKPLCFTIGFLLTFVVAAGFMWHFATAHHMYEKMVLQKVETSPVLCEMPCGRTTGKFRQRDLAVQLIVWPTSLAVALVPAFGAMITGEPVYTKTADGDMCWIGGPSAHVWRLCAVFLPMVAVVVATCYLYGRVLKLVIAGLRYAKDQRAKSRLRMAAARVGAYPAILCLPVVALVADEVVDFTGGSGAVKVVSTCVAVAAIAGRGLLHALVYFSNAQNSQRYGRYARTLRRASTSAFTSSIEKLRQQSHRSGMAADEESPLNGGQEEAPLLDTDESEEEEEEPRKPRRRQFRVQQPHGEDGEKGGGEPTQL